MRCDEIRERFVELLYDEQGTPPASPELQAHIRSCPSCQRELKELSSVQKVLRFWEDEPPLRPVTVPHGDPAHRPRLPVVWRMVKYGAIAAVLVLAFLGLTNADIRWDKEGFSLQTHWIPWRPANSDYYTKAEIIQLIRGAQDDTESRMMEASRLMILQGLDTAEAERDRDFRLIEHRLSKGLNKN